MSCVPTISLFALCETTLCKFQKAREFPPPTLINIIPSEIRVLFQKGYVDIEITQIGQWSCSLAFMSIPIGQFELSRYRYQPSETAPSYELTC